MNQNKNSGVVYKGYLVPYFITREQQRGKDRYGGYVINKPTLNSQYQKHYFRPFFKEIDENPNMTNKEWETTLRELLEQKKFKELDTTSKNKAIDAVMKDWKTDTNKRAKALMWSKQNADDRKYGSISVADLRKHNTEADTKGALVIQTKKAEVATKIIKGATNIDEKTKEERVRDAQVVSEMLDDLRKEMTTQEFRAFMDANAKNWKDAQGNDDVKKATADIQRQKNLNHQKVFTETQRTLEAEIKALTDKTEKLKKKYRTELREATFANIQGIVENIYKETPQEDRDNLFTEDFVDMGRLLRRPTAEELRHIVMLYNNISGKHRPALPQLAYKIDETDPQIIEMNRQSDAYIQQNTEEAEAHIKEIRQQHADLKKQLDAEEATLRQQIETAQDEAKKILQQDLATIQGLEKTHEQEDNQQKISDDIRQKTKIQHRIYLTALKKDKANLEAEVAQMNTKILSLGDKSYSDTESIDISEFSTDEEEDLAAKFKSSQSENVSLEVKEGTGEIIDNTGSSGIGAGADANTQKNSGTMPPPPSNAPPGQLAPYGRVVAGNIIADFVGYYFRNLRRHRVNMGQRIAEGLNDQHYKDERREELRQLHEDWINNVGVPMGLQLPHNVNNTGELVSSSYEENQQQSQSAYEADQKAKMEADYDTKTDAIADVSKFGYDKQVSKYAKEQGRDFTYTMSMIQKSKNAPSQNPNERMKQKDALLKEWGYTIGILKAKGNSYEECLEIYTIIFLAEDLYRLERNWKKAIIKFLPYLENLSHQSSVGNQLGLITASQTPMTMEQADQLISETQRQGSITRGQLRQMGGRRQGRRPTRQTPQSPPSMTGAPPSMASAGSSVASGSAEGKSDTRRRLTGFGREVNYTQTADNTIVGQDYSATGIASARLPHMPSGIQSVRQVKAQLPRPPIRTAKRDGRPKMNVEKAKFRMRKSRINPNLLFVNLDKQNPNLTQEMPIFRPRVKNKELNRIKF